MFQKLIFGLFISVALASNLVHAESDFDISLDVMASLTAKPVALSVLDYNASPVIHIVFDREYAGLGYPRGSYGIVKGEEIAQFSKNRLTTKLKRGLYEVVVRSKAGQSDAISHDSAYLVVGGNPARPTVTLEPNDRYSSGHFTFRLN